MSVYAKIFTLAALLCPLASAADCAGGSCTDLNDETSLLQVEKAVSRHGGPVQPKKVADFADEDPADLVSEGEEEDVVEHANSTSGSDSFCSNTKYVRIGAGDYYRRANAQKATLGSYGNYQNCWTCSHTMDFQESPKMAWLTPPAEKVMVETHVQLSSSEKSEFAATGQVSAALRVAKVHANAGASGSHVATAGFKAVVTRFQSRQALLEAINADSFALGALRSYKAPRIAIGTIRLEGPGEFDDADCLAVNAGAGAEEATGSYSGSASGSRSSCSHMIATFSPGTVIAYRLAEPVWDSGKNKITAMKVDQPCGYLNPTCGCNQFITR